MSYLEKDEKETNLKNGIPDILHLLFSPYWIHHDWSHLHLSVLDSFCCGVVDDIGSRHIHPHPLLHPCHWLPPHEHPLHHHAHIHQVNMILLNLNI